MRPSSSPSSQVSASNHTQNKLQESPSHLDRLFLVGALLLGTLIGYGAFETWKLPPWHHEMWLHYRVAAALANGISATLSILFFALLAPLFFFQQDRPKPRIFSLFQISLWGWWLFAWVGLGLPMFGWAGLSVWLACVLLLVYVHSDETSWGSLIQRALPWVILGAMLLNFAQPLFAWLWRFAPWLCPAMAVLCLLQWPWKENKSNLIFAMACLLFGAGPWLAREQRYTSVMHLPHLEQMRPYTAKVLLSGIEGDKSLSLQSRTKFLQSFLGRKASRAQATQAIFRLWGQESTPSALPYTLLTQIDWTQPSENALLQALSKHPKHQVLLREQALRGLQESYSAPIALRLMGLLLKRFPQHKASIETHLFQRYLLSTEKDPQKREHLRVALQYIRGKDFKEALYRFFFSSYSKQPLLTKDRWTRRLAEMSQKDAKLLHARFSAPLTALLKRLFRDKHRRYQREALQILSSVGHREPDWQTQFLEGFPPHFLEKLSAQKEPSLRALAMSIRLQRWASNPLRIQQLTQALHDPAQKVQLIALKAFPEIHQQLQQSAPDERLPASLQQRLYQVSLHAISHHPEYIESIARTLPKLQLTATQKARVFAAGKALLATNQPRTAHFLRFLFMLLADFEPQNKATSATSRPKVPSSQPTSQRLPTIHKQNLAPTSRTANRPTTSRKSTSRPKPLFH
ncbi:MAG: hypothetical protein H6728_02745 [Myxococcales bacterium]|nr:hypothetical protein [Myxococcales bacterium]